MPNPSHSAPPPTTAATIAEWIDAALVGHADVTVNDGAPIDRARCGEVTYATNKSKVANVLRSQATAVIVPADLAERMAAEAAAGSTAPTLLIVDGDPQTAFTVALSHLRPRRERPTIGISPKAFVSESAVIGANTNVHPTAHVMDDVVIGEGCDIMPGAYIGPGCRIGNGVVVHPYAVLYENVELGDRVTIHATAVIGADGFGYRLVEGRHVRIPHFGGVRIEDDAEIGASSTIDRGMIGSTVIGEGSKLDNLVMVAHNCELGKHNVIVGQVGFAGSCSTGDYVVCAGHVGVADHVHLGKGAVLGSKAGVNKDVPAGETWIGQPAQPVQEAMRTVMASKKVPEMRKQLRTLEKRIDSLEESHRTPGFGPPEGEATAA